ncbi:hypothetical protein [Paenibacillus medicaginis]|uniref:Uncharacterized protein n=1 Tax=Paenibacillus medicaginis TaxID=1470560 RepID=A0ABV5C1B1_9BACL
MMGVHAIQHMYDLRGDTMAEKQSVTGNAVETYRLGNTTIEICGDDIVQTQEEINDIIREMHRIAWKFIVANRDKAE